MTGLIGIDWGTSSLRGYWLDAHGAIRETRARPWGVRQLPEGGFDMALADLIEGWPPLPRLACGMIGSRNGWQEVPYLTLPVDATQLGATLGRVLCADGRPLHIVAGLREPLGPDVMRGEETQLIGALALHPQHARQSTWLLPGTHSKWASVRDGVMVDFCTLLTGELYALLRKHSILGATGDAVDDADAFARGVTAARDSGAAGALSRLFSARALMLDGLLAATSVPDYLSGLLLGEELRAIKTSHRYRLDAPVQLIGDATLCARYRDAARHFDIELAEPLVDAAAHGLWQIALASGLLVDSTPMQPAAHPC